MEQLLLAGDVGGTKTALALVEPGRGPLRVVAEAIYDSRRPGQLDGMVREFLADHPGRVRWASFSVAGPVIGGRVQLSNLGWSIDQEEFRRSFGLAAVRLLNDLHATAYALPHLHPEQLLTLQPGEPGAGGARAVVAPGTGLGEAFVLPTAAGFQAFPSEGGNADFAPGDRLQVELFQHLLARNGHVSYEDVCSGRGIPNVYRFLRDTGRAQEPAWLRDRLAGVADPGPVIVETGLDETTVPDSLCAMTLDLFTSILAAEAGNLALRVLSTGGVFLGGGIPPRILPLLRTERFLERFRHKGHFSELLRHIPLHVILEPRTALLGAARHGLEMGAPASATSLAGA